MLTTKEILKKVRILEIKNKKLNDQQAAERFKPVIPYLIKVNKCPDFVEDKGHMFGTDLPMADKKALIELLMVVGQYHLVSFFLNSAGVAREDGVPGFS